MIKKTITYEDFDGNKITEDFHFHMSEPELAEFSVETSGGLSTTARKLVKTTSAKETLELVKDLIRRSYGVIHEDSRRFVKDPELTKAFMETDAYSVLYLELLDGDALSKFITGVMPKNLAKKLDGVDVKRQLIDKSGTLRFDDGYNVEAEWGDTPVAAKN